MADSTPDGGTNGAGSDGGMGSDDRIDSGDGTSRRRVLAGVAAALTLAPTAGRTSARNQALPNRIAVQAYYPEVLYRFSTTSRVRKGSEADPSDYVLQGIVGGGRVRRYDVDDFTYSGLINSFTANGPLRIYVNGRRVLNPRERFDRGTTRGTTRRDRGGRDRRRWTLVSVRGESFRPADYTLVASGRIEPDGDVEFRDEFDGEGIVRGTVAGGGVDHYRYTGALTFFDSRGGPVRVTIRT